MTLSMGERLAIVKYSVGFAGSSPEEIDGADDLGNEARPEKEIAVEQGA